MDHGKLALEAHRENRVADALHHYGRLLEEQPGSAEGWLAYGMLLHIKTGDFANAEQCYRNALHLKADLAQGALQLGTLLSQQDRQVEAIPFLQQAVASGQERGYSELTCAYIRVGDVALAERTARSYAAQNNLGYFSQYLLAWIQAWQGNLNEALDYASEAVLLDPGYPIPLGFQALLLWQLGRQAESRRVLQEMVAAHGALVAQSWGANRHLEACEYWCSLRTEAKERLALGQTQPVNFINLTGGLGDQYFAASLFQAFRRINPEQPLVAIADHEARWEELFPDAADLFLHVDKDKTALLAGCNRFFPDHPYTPFFPWIGPLVSLYSLRHFSKCFLGIPIGMHDQIPRPSRRLLDEVRNKFAALGGMPGRSVLIGPVSNSNPMLPVQWWIDCVAYLRQIGLIVFQNTKNMWNPAPIDALPGTIPIDLPLQEAVPFCTLAGHYLGVRNGLCDLLLRTEARKKALHVRRRYATNDKYPLSVWLDYRSGYSLRRCSESAQWQDIDIGAGDVFDPILLADWQAEVPTTMPPSP